MISPEMWALCLQPVLVYIVLAIVVILGCLVGSVEQQIVCVPQDPFLHRFGLFSSFFPASTNSKHQ